MKHAFFVISALLFCLALVGCSDLISDERFIGGESGDTRNVTSSRTGSLEDGKQGAEITDPLWLQNVIGKNWYLIELRQTGGVGIVPYEDIQQQEGVFRFTLNFNVEDVKGFGYANNYFGPYILGNGQALSIKNLAVTLRALAKEPDGLKENDYFNYLVNSYRWSIVDGNLELYSQGEDGKETVLVFAALEGSDDGNHVGGTGDDPNTPVVHTPQN